MIDGKELFATLPHPALGREKILGCRFVCDLRIEGHIAQRVKAFCMLAFAPNQATTLDWIDQVSLRNDVVDVYPSELDHDSRAALDHKRGDGGLSGV